MDGRQGVTSRMRGAEAADQGLVEGWGVASAEVAPFPEDERAPRAVLSFLRGTAAGPPRDGLYRFPLYDLSRGG